jgi:hypothetical protein
MKTESEVADVHIETFLAPLARIRPAARQRPEPHPVRRLVLVATVLILLIGGGAFAATKVFGPLHHAVITPPRTPITCSGVIGGSAHHAATYFATHGYQVSWRFMHWGAQVESGVQGSGVQAIGGSHSETIEKPPPDSVVWDATRVGPNQVIVQVQAPDDPNAPQLVQPNCERRP